MKAFLNNMTLRRLTRRIVRWLLAVTIIVALITGFGITEYGIVESLTFGLLTKSLAFKIHATPGLWPTLLVLLIWHVFSGYIFKVKNKMFSAG